MYQQKVESLQHVFTNNLPIMEIDILLKYKERGKLRQWSRASLLGGRLSGQNSYA